MVLKGLFYAALFCFLTEARANSSTSSKIQRFFARTTSLRCQHPDVVFDVSSLSICAAACSQDVNCLGFNLNRFNENIGRICEVVKSKDDCNYHGSFNFYEAINPDHADTSLTPVTSATTSASAPTVTLTASTTSQTSSSVLSTTTDEFPIISTHLTSTTKDPSSAGSRGVVSISSSAQMLTVSNSPMMISAAVPSTSATLNSPLTSTTATIPTALAASSTLSTSTTTTTPSTAIVQSTTTSIATITPSPTALSSSETPTATVATTTAATTTSLSPAKTTLTTTTMPAITTVQTTTTPTTSTTPATTTSTTTTTQTTALTLTTATTEGSENGKCSDNTGNYAITGIDVSNWLILHTSPFALEDGEGAQTVYKGTECDPGWALMQIACFGGKCYCKRVGSAAILDNTDCEEVSGKSGDIMCPDQKIATMYSFKGFTFTHTLKCCTLIVN